MVLVAERYIIDDFGDDNGHEDHNYFEYFYKF